MIMKPIYCKCERCGEVSEEADLAKDYTNGGYRGEPHTACPYCGCEDLNDVEQCAECGEYVERVYGYGDSAICKDCLDAHAANEDEVFEYGAQNTDDVTINGFLAFVYSPEEIEEILMNDFKKCSADWQARMKRDYVAEDEDDFAEYAAS